MKEEYQGRIPCNNTTAIIIIIHPIDRVHITNHTTHHNHAFNKKLYFYELKRFSAITAFFRPSYHIPHKSKIIMNLAINVSESTEICLEVLYILLI